MMCDRYLRTVRLSVQYMGLVDRNNAGHVVINPGHVVINPSHVVIKHVPSMSQSIRLENGYSDV